MKDDPKVSVIIPVFNGLEFIEESVQSVLSQSFSDFELIIVDDGSIDESGSLIEEIAGRDSRIRFFSKSNSGQSAARNFGVMKSKGTYLSFLDQDDCFLPGKLEITVKYLDSHPDCAAVYTNLDVIDRRGRTVARNALTNNNSPIPRVPHPKTSLMDCLAKDMFILPGTFVVRRSVFDQAGGFDEDLIGLEDDDLFLRIFCYFNIDFLNVSTLRWRLYSSSTSYSVKMDTSRMKYFLKLLREFPDDPVMQLRWGADVIVPRFCKACFSEIIRSKTAGNFDRARRLWNSIESYPSCPWWFYCLYPLMWPPAPAFFGRIVTGLRRLFRSRNND